MRGPIAVATTLFLGCAAQRAGAPAPPGGQGPADGSAQVLAIADEYLARFFAEHPEDATLDDWPRADHGAVADVSPAALARWRAFEDSVSARLTALAPGPLTERARLSRA